MQEYAHLQHGFALSTVTAEHLSNAFEGWITGILLATSLGNVSASPAFHYADPPGDSLALFMDQEALLAYVTNNVFAAEGQALKFLQETSVLQHLSATLCNQLLQIEHAEALLTHIERQGLFLKRVPGQRLAPTYSLHSALRRLLWEDLQRNQPERAAFFHKRAAMLFRSLGDDEQAITHAIAAQEYSLAIEIIVQAVGNLSEEALLHTNLVRWIELLPTGECEQHPHLLLLRAKVSIAQHKYLQAASLLERAFQLAMHPSQACDGATDPVVIAEILLARSTVLFREGKYGQSQQFCHKVLECLSVDQTELRILALLRLGICQTLVGDHTEGLASFHQALQLSGHANMTRRTASIHSYLANSYTLTGNYALAEHHRMRSLTLAEHLNDLQGKINNLIWMAILRRNTGALQEAETMLQEILIQARQAGFQSGEAYALFNLGANFVDRNAFPPALTSLEESLSLAHLLGDNRLADQCLCELSMAYMLMGDNCTAQILLAQTTAASVEHTGYERIGYELVRGTLLLYQQNVKEADACFRALVPLVQHAQLKRAHIECLIRLAVCLYKRNRLDEMGESMEKVVQLVKQGHFEHIPLLELRRFPDAWKVVQTFSDAACLPAWRDSAHWPREEKHTAKNQSSPRESRPTCKLPEKARLHIQALGEPCVMIDGVPVTHWHLARSMELCFFFLEHQRPIRKEQLIEALWSEEEEYVDQKVRSTLHYLRKALGGSCLISRGGVYALDLSTLYGDDIWYDVTVFQDHHTRAQEALKATDSEQAEEHLLAMTELYQGDYVQSFYSDWCIPRRDELRQWYMDARRELARMNWKKEYYEECMVHWQQLLAIDPCVEEAHFGLMRCYIRLGKRNLAARQYQRCSEVLQRELALSPGPALQKLYQQLRHHDEQKQAQQDKTLL